MVPFQDPLHVCIALGPLAVYLVLLGAINLATRPLLTTGARDTVALGIAISGFVVAGPMELFLPEAAAARFGGYLWVWLLLLAFYGLCLTLVVLLMRPRLVIYNVTLDRLRPILADVVAELDKDARWAGESLVLPQLGVQLHVEPFEALRCAQLVSAGPRQDYAGWKRLEYALHAALLDTRVAPSPYGFTLLGIGSVLAVLLTAWMISAPQEVAQSLRNMFRI